MKTLLLVAALALGGATMAQATPVVAHASKLPQCSKTVTKNCTPAAKHTTHRMRHHAAATQAAPATKAPATK
ncbi:hypothetical protein ACFO8O_02715 [Hephaestia sp. GCM10023244]|uniref:hypothetical protein n=1 Tax=unclassified Hephaestia TaxID=2631281 RepID=UPI0020779527|nr:hypothetical protein [Hephaestia sp. MAHUQ-44]MCM8729884.1 hypothetical protein [Hephaestia sp. MAHUQ-44]